MKTIYIKMFFLFCFYNGVGQICNYKKSITFISQVYVNGNDKFIEIKNKTNTPIPANTYNLALYTNALSLGGVPTATMAVPAIAGNGTIVFRTNNATQPVYASTSTTILPTAFNVFDGDSDVLMLTTATGTDLTSTTNNTAYLERVDQTGNTTQWCVNKSLVRSSCANSFPKTSFDSDDWVEFTTVEVSDAFSQTNAVLGRHNFDVLSYNFSNQWEENGIANTSLPDRSREVFFENSYTTTPTNSLEVCSLTLGNGVTVTVVSNSYASVQINVEVNDGAHLDIQDGASLIMVKDHYDTGTAAGVLYGNALVVNQGTPVGSINVTKTNHSVDSMFDHVYWSSPLTDNPINAILPTDNRISHLFPAVIVDYNRIFSCSNNHHIFDPLYPDTGENDTVDFWNRLYGSEKDQLMTPGHGYTCYGSSMPYTLNFNGQANNGIVSVPVFRNNSTVDDNSNMVGNPYPSPIDLDVLFEVNHDLIYPYAAVWGRSVDGPIPFVITPYLTWNLDNYLIYSPTMPINPGNIDFGNDGILSSCQAFMIQTRKESVNPPNSLFMTPTTATAFGGSVEQAGTLVFNNSMRSTSPLNTFARGANVVTDTKTKLWLNLTDENGTKKAQMGIAFLEKGKDTFDPDEDVQAFVGGKLGFYSKSDKHDLIINALSTFDMQKTVSLGIVNCLENNSKLSIAIDKATGALQDHEIFLYDRITSKIVNITWEPYAFEPNNKIMDDRFTLLFQNKIETEISELGQNKVVVFAKDGVVTVNSLTDKRISAVYVSDLYTPSIGGVEIAKNENINNKMFQFRADSKYKILNIKVVLEDGTVVNKKVAP